MVVRGHPSLSLSRQCRLLSVGRSSLYYEPKGESTETLALMGRIDALFLKYPFYGARQMARHLRREGVRIGRHRVARLMRLLGLQAVYRAPRTSAPQPEHRVWPYVLKGLRIERANHVWCADITDIPVSCGFLYLVAIMDWASRFVLAWRLSNTLDAGFCTDALDEALARYGTPEIFNTDQGSQFTSFAFTGRLQEAGIRISMDGRGRFMDNVRPLTRTDGVRGLSHRTAVALAQIRGDLPARDRRRLHRPARHRPVDRLLQRREASLGAGRKDAGRSLPERPACGYDGQVAPRLAHIPTGATAEARGSIQGEYGGLTINRNRLCT